MPVIPEGVYSETKIQKIGTMGTSRTQTIVDYYTCKQEDENTVVIQILDMYGDPIPLVEKIPVEDFLKRFTYEPEQFKTKKTPSDMTTVKAIATAERHVARKEYNSAEFEYSKALKLDTENVRASFGLGKLYLQTGEAEKAVKVFSSLSQQENVLEPGNKHFFNELGIELRNLKLYDQAIEFYKKALEMASDDEHLLFNMARAYIDSGDKDMAVEYIDRALAVNPELETAQKVRASLLK